MFDLSVFYVQRTLLITGIKLFRELFVTFNVCFSVNRENTKKMINQHKKVHFESIRAFREFWKSTVTFSGQDNTGYLFKCGLSGTIRRFRKTFSNPDKFCRRTTTNRGATTTRGGRNKFTLSFIFPF
jgi:hypothetical protein